MNKFFELVKLNPNNNQLALLLSYVKVNFNNFDIKNKNTMELWDVITDKFNGINITSVEKTEDNTYTATAELHGEIYNLMINNEKGNEGFLIELQPLDPNNYYSFKMIAQDAVEVDRLDQYGEIATNIQQGICCSSSISISETLAINNHYLYSDTAMTLGSKDLEYKYPSILVNSVSLIPEDIARRLIAGEDIIDENYNKNDDFYELSRLVIDDYDHKMAFYGLPCPSQREHEDYQRWGDKYYFDDKIINEISMDSKRRHSLITLQNQYMNQVDYYNVVTSNLNEIDQEIKHNRI